MKTSKKDIDLYVSADGHCPYKVWFEALQDVQAKARILKRLTRIEMGNLGECNFVGEGVHELKMDYGPGYRIYFGQAGINRIVLLCAGTKNMQGRDVMKARHYWADWRNR